MADDTDDQTPEQVLDSAPGGLPDNNDAATRLGYAGDNTPPSSEAAGPPQGGVPEAPPEKKKRTKEEDIARETTTKEVTGQDPTDPLGNAVRGVGNFFSGLANARNPGTNDPLGAGIGAIRDYLTNKNGAPAGDVAAAIKKANPDGSLAPDVATVKAVADEPSWERKAALQSGMLDIARRARSHARAAADNNNWNQADAFVNEGSKYTPNGEALTITRHGNGVIATVSHLGTDKQDVVNLTPQQYSQWLHSSASDPDNAMRGELAAGLRGITQQQRGEAGPSMSLGTTDEDTGQQGPARPMQQIRADMNVAARENAPELADRTAERRIAQQVNPQDAAHSNEIAEQLLDVQRQRSNDMEAARKAAGLPADMYGARRPEDYTAQAGIDAQNIRRDKDGNLWTQDPSGKVVPYNAAIAQTLDVNRINRPQPAREAGTVIPTSVNVPTSDIHPGVPVAVARVGGGGGHQAPQQEPRAPAAPQPRKSGFHRRDRHHRRQTQGQ